VPFLDDATLNAIESDLAAAHESLSMEHGDLKMKNTGHALRSGLEVLAPAALFSYANARSAGGELKVGPVPVDLGVAIACVLASLFDWAGDYSEDLLYVGLGAGASYAARTGAAFGAAKAGLTQTSGAEISGAKHISGALPWGSKVPAGTQRFVVQQVSG
jgi:hypothetical protein